jgi:hypothetical protein
MQSETLELHKMLLLRFYDDLGTYATPYTPYLTQGGGPSNRQGKGTVYSVLLHEGALPIKPRL